METSQTLGQLAKALAVAQGQFKPIRRESINPYFKSKYADLAAIIDGTRDALAKNSLAFTQAVSVNDHVVVETLLMHESGEWVRGSISLKPKADDPQAAGSAITYGRRYSLGAILGVASEDDDDGNAGSKTGSESKSEAKTETKPTIKDPDAPASDMQKRAIVQMLEKLGVKDKMAQYQRVSEICAIVPPLTSIAALSKGEASKVIETLGKELPV